MAIQYYMRGYNIALPGTVGYVDWVVNDVPDSSATYVPAPYISGNITNITVNRIVTSKVDNFLKPFESLAAIDEPGYDGYFFHLNSYDWLHATPPGPPIPVPAYLTGLSVVRGTVDGVIPRDYATLFWAENALKWLFAYNTNGDGYTIGSALPVGMGSLSVDGYIEVGTNPAESGIIRIPNNQFIVSRNATDTADGYLIGQDGYDRVRLGSPPGNQIYIPANLRVDGYVRDGDPNLALDNASLSGFIRNLNNTSIITFRNALNNADITALSSTAGNLIILGDAVNSGIRYNTSTGSEHIWQINTTNLLRVGNIGGTSYVNFENSALLPTVSQFTRSVGAGQNLTVKAQDTTSGGDPGGSVIISSGNGPSATGYIDLSINNDPKVRVFGAVPVDPPNFNAVPANNPNSVQLMNNTVRWYHTISNPTIKQDDVNGADGFNMLIKAQSGIGVSPFRRGGDLILSSGAGQLDTIDGYVRLQTGQIDRLFVDANANRITQTLSIFAFNGLDGTFDAASVANPIIRQRDDISAPLGQLMTIQAQNTTAGGSVGGSLNITSGDGVAADGYVRIQTGGVTRMFYDATAGQGTFTLGTWSFNGLDGGPDAVNIVNPVIRQRNDNTSSVSGNSLTIRSQSTPNNGTAGNLILNTGTGTAIQPASGNGPAYTRHGRLFFETGSNTTNNVGEFFIDGYGPYFSVGGTTSAPAAIDGYFRVPNNTWALSAARNGGSPPTASIHLIGTSATNQILIGDVNDTTYIPGNLIIGTFTANTTLHIEDRLIHANYNVAVAGPPVPPPSLITGLTVYRGDDGALTYNNKAGVIWTEGINLNATDGYWKIASVLPTGSGNDLTLVDSLNIMGRSLSITNDPNLAAGLLPAVGGLRTLNNTTAVASRNAASSADLLLLGTDNNDHIVLGAISSPFNTGFIFNTTLGSVYDFRVNSTSNKIQIGDGYIRAGAIPSLSGVFRNTQNSNVLNPIITIRNLANNDDHILLASDGYDRVLHGSNGINLGHIFNTSVGSVYDFQVNSVSNKIQISGGPTASDLDGYIRSGATPASVGILRTSQNSTVATEVVTSRDFANTLDLKLLGVDGYDRITHGSDADNKGHIFDTAVDGYYDFRVNSIPSVNIDGYKLSFRKGRRRHITSVSNTYIVLLTDDFLAVDAASVYTITLPDSPELGDTYEFKDVNGTSTTNNITIDGNGNNIDGISTLVMNVNFASFVVTWTGAQWSIS